MNGLFGKNPKKSLERSKAAVFPGILASSTAVGTLGFQAALDVSPRGKWSHSYHNIAVVKPDSTVAQGGKDNGGSRNASQAKRKEDQEHPTPEILTPGVVDDTEHGNHPSGECFQPPFPVPTFMQTSTPLCTRKEQT